MINRTFSTIVVATLLVSLHSGCQSNPLCRNLCNPRQPSGGFTSSPNTNAVPFPIQTTPIQQGGLPPGNLPPPPVGNPPANGLPPQRLQPQPQQQPGFLPPSEDPLSNSNGQPNSSFRPSTPYNGDTPRWQPGQSGQIQRPNPLNERGNVQLGTPEPINSDRSPSGNQPKVQEERSPSPSNVEPSQNENSAPAMPLPVGIPQFSIVKDGITAGLRPRLDGGLNWLQRNKYRTVLHIHEPGADTAPDREQVEQRGMTYISLAVSPQTLNSQVVADFTKVVTDRSGYPLFVYDRDGSLAGGLWYLYFRQTEGMDPEVARITAGPLGLRESRSDAHREMWLAVQQYLSQQR